jgi:hypothetical protein
VTDGGGSSFGVKHHSRNSLLMRGVVSCVRGGFGLGEPDDGCVRECPVPAKRGLISDGLGTVVTCYPRGIVDLGKRTR